MKQQTGEETETTAPYTTNNGVGNKEGEEHSIIPDIKPCNALPNVDDYIKTLHKTILD